MPPHPPPAPAFGVALAPVASAEMLQRLAWRRSSSAHLLTFPAPTAEQLDDLLRLSVRTPDHGKMTPWRFVVFEGEAKTDFVERLGRLADARVDPAKAHALLLKLANPPLAVAVISSPRLGGKAVVEQVASAAAVCTLMLLAADAMGFGANWITDWYAEDDAALRLVGVDRAAAVPETIAGWILVGTPSEPPLERVRPDVAALTRRWSPPA